MNDYETISENNNIINRNKKDKTVYYLIVYETRDSNEEILSFLSTITGTFLPNGHDIISVEIVNDNAPQKLPNLSELVDDAYAEIRKKFYPTE